MTTETLDLCGKVCPYPVVQIIREVDKLRPGESCRCVVDDPLAIKSVPEELEDYEDIEVVIEPRGRVWEVMIRRS